VICQHIGARPMIVAMFHVWILSFHLSSNYHSTASNARPVAGLDAKVTWVRARTL